jgi:hypothetical protein
MLKPESSSMTKNVKEATGFVADTDANDNARRYRAYGWYSRISMPNRANMKRRVEALEVQDIAVDNVDLLPWNSIGSTVNVAKMNVMLRASMRKL